MNGRALLTAALSTLLLGACGARAEQVGAVDTVFKFIGPDHKIVVDAYDDPKVAGVTCYVSRAKTGGIKGGLGLACLLYTSPSPRDLSTSRMPSSA